MSVPFIRNHQYNLIKKQANLLHHSCNTVSDPKVVESVRVGVQSVVAQAFPAVSEQQQALLDSVVSIYTAIDLDRYLRSLEPYLSGFEQVTDTQLKKLFPKNKKLKLPELAAIDYRFVTYLGWTDIATGKLFLVYRLGDRLVGIEGRFTPVHKKSVCFLCNRHEEVALFSAVTRLKPAKASSDYYKAIGNYMCIDSATCNRNITDITALEKFISNVVG